MASPATELAPSILKHAKIAFEQTRKQDINASDDLASFLNRLTNSRSSNALPVTPDLHHPIAQYFISSSHNTYLSGNQLWSKSSTEAYRDVLRRGCRCIEIDVWDGGVPSSASSDTEGAENVKPKGENEIEKLAERVRKGLRGFREADASPEIEQKTESSHGAEDEISLPTPWQASAREEPRVLHGYTATKEIPFRKVAKVIRDYAFVSSTLPLIVSLEVHCSKDQQEIMVEIMKDYWNPYLVSLPDGYDDNTPLPLLESLEKKILIKVKYTSPEKASKGHDGKVIARTKALSDAMAEKTQSKRRSRASSSLTQASSEDETQVGPAKKGNICEALSSLGIYTRSCHFHSLDQPEAKIPTHVFALGEGKVSELQERDSRGLFRHNIEFFMRVYPKGTRVRSTNLDPAPFWRQGIQMVALNWQQPNAAMMLNEAMFEATGGWMLKPDGYRTAGDDQPTVKRQRLDLSIQILAGQHLSLDSKLTPHAYVKCELHVECKTEKTSGQIPEGGKSKGGESKRRSATRHSRDPDWSGEVISFVGKFDVLPELSFVR